MELHQAVVEHQKSLILPWAEETLIVPIGDVQYGVPACDTDRLQRLVDWAMAKPKRGEKAKSVYFIGMGDYVDFGSPSNRSALKAMIAKGELYDSAVSAIDQAAEEHIANLLDILGPTKGKWLGLVEGHHYWSFNDGTTSDTRLAQALEAPFLGTCAILQVRWDDPWKNAPGTAGKGGPSPFNPYMNIWVHHGRGSGQTQGAPINKLEKLANAWDDIDVFLMGHHHKKGAAKIQKIRPRFSGAPHGRHKLEHRNVILAGTGSYLKGYLVGSQRDGRAGGTYVEQGMMTPVALGGVVIWARPVSEKSGHKRVDIDVSL